METNAVGAETLEGAMPVFEKFQTLGLEYGVKVLGALAVLIIGMWMVKQLKKGIIKVLKKRSVDPTLISFTVGMLYAVMQIFVIVAALERLDIKTTSFVAILGAAGLAVGLALQGSLSNFAAGVLMIIFKPFRVDDFVEIGGADGFVVEISIFTTILTTLDNKKVIVPNSKVMGDTITNYTANSTRRVDLVAGISYADDIDKARAAIRAAMAGVDTILKSPAPEILVSEMADSSVNFAVRPWCKPDDYWPVYFAVTEAIKKQFDADGICIPFPQRDVHLYEH